MSIKLRRLIYISFFLLFFIAGPIIAAYATGYRINFANLSMAKVGAIYLKTYPTGASIYLDGEDTFKQTPARLLNVWPGEHLVTLERENFIQWEKKLLIDQGETTFIRDAVLFVASPEITELSSGGANAISSTDNSLYILLSDTNEIILTNTESENIFIINLPVSADEIISLSPNNNLALIIRGQKSYILDLNTEDITELEIGSSSSIKKAFFDHHNASTIWLQLNDKLYLYNLLTSELNLQFSDISDFYISSDYIATSQVTDQGTLISLHDLGSNNPLWVKQLPLNVPITIEAINNQGLVTLLGENSVWLVNQENLDTPLFLDAHHIDWHDDKLLIANDFEIKYYNHSTNEVKLLDRTAKKIEQILWHPSGSYIVRQLENKIEIFELDDRDIRNNTLVTEVDEKVNIFFDKKGENLYLISPDRNMLYNIQ